MIILTKPQRKQMITALRTLGEKVESLIETLNVKYDKGTLCCGEEWLLDHLSSVEFCESRKSLEDRTDEELYDTIIDFGMAAESIWSDLDGDGEWPHGPTAKNILDQFIKVARKYSRPMIQG